MLQEVVLPRLGQTMEEGTVEKWHKSEGDTVEKGEVLFELTTDKATLEVESFASGVVKKILVEEGQTVPVNELVAVIGDEEDELPEDLESLKKKAAEKEEGTAEPAAEKQEKAAAAESTEPPPRPAGRPAGRIFASPRARKVAEEQEVPLSVLRGSGPNGRIIEKDVRTYLDRLEEVKCTPTARRLAYLRGVDLLAVRPSGGDGRITKDDVEQAAGRAVPAAGERIELSPMRRTIAERMTRSKQTVPHFYLVGRVRMQRTVELRERLTAESDEKISLTAMLVKAAALGLRDHPRVNAQFSEGEIVLNERANVGVAVAVEDGLFVPVVKDADRKQVKAISSELKELVGLAREGRLIPEQYEGGSLTISNLGMFGVEYFLPIINPPESCIIGVGEIGEEVVARDGAIAVETVMKVSLSADHRVVDGAEAARFFQTFKDVLQEADRLQ